MKLMLYLILQMSIWASSLILKKLMDSPNSVKLMRSETKREPRSPQMISLHWKWQLPLAQLDPPSVDQERSPPLPPRQPLPLQTLLQMTHATISLILHVNFQRSKLFLALWTPSGSWTSWNSKTELSPRCKPPKVIFHIQTWHLFQNLLNNTLSTMVSFHSLSWLRLIRTSQLKTLIPYSSIQSHLQELLTKSKLITLLSLNMVKMLPNTSKLEKPTTVKSLRTSLTTKRTSSNTKREMYSPVSSVAKNLSPQK